MPGPLLTAAVQRQLEAAALARVAAIEVSLDLGRTTTRVGIEADGWTWQGRRFPFLHDSRDRTVYWWTGQTFEPASRFAGSLVKLVPTEWGAPTFEIDGIKMLATAKRSPVEDAQRKVALVEPRGKVVLDTCGGLGYFASACLEQGVGKVLSFEKNPDVLWLRALNPWSPPTDPLIELREADIVEESTKIGEASVDAVLHDPPRFGIAGELYSLAFYRELARVLKRKGRLFHYTGTPNRLTSGRDVPREVAKRLQAAGFTTRLEGDGVLAVKS